MVRSLRVAGTSPPIRLGELDENLASVRGAFQHAVSRGAELIVAPELATTGFVKTADDAWPVAMTADDPRLVEVGSDLPEGTVAVFGFCESRNGELFNSCVALTRSRVIGLYRKTHLWGIETQFFATGDEAPPILETPVGKVALAICYDNEFPEVPRGLALGGAEILALPVNWPVVDRPKGQHPPETIQAMAASRSSRMATVIADRRGTEDGVEWTGATNVVSSDGWLVGQLDDDGGIAVADLVLPSGPDKRAGEFNDLFADRRPDVYALLAATRHHLHEGDGA